MSISLFRIACLIGLSCTIAFGEDHKKPSSALPPSLKKAIASLKSDKQSTHGNTPKAEELATIVGFSMKMTAAFSAKDHKELSKVLAKNKGGGTWCQLTKGRVAILFEFEGFEEVQGESREFFIGFLWPFKRQLLISIQHQPKPRLVLSMPRESLVSFEANLSANQLQRT